MLKMTFQENGDVSFAGRFDASQTEYADQILGKVMQSCTLDFTNLDYISSAGLGTLLHHQKRLMEKGQAMKILHPNKHIRDVFTFTGFDNLFKIE